MVRKIAAVAPIAALCVLALSACDNSEPAATDGQTAGEVVEGTISDAMIPLAEVRSEPPPEDPIAAEASENTAETTETGSADTEESTAASDDAPADTPDDAPDTDEAAE